MFTNRRIFKHYAKHYAVKVGIFVGVNGVGTVCFFAFTHALGWI